MNEQRRYVEQRLAEGRRRDRKEKKFYDRIGRAYQFAQRQKKKPKKKKKSDS